MLSLLLPDLDLLLQHDGPFDGDIVLGLEVFQGRRGSPRLAFKVIVGHLDIAQSQLEGPVGVAEGGDLFLECALGRVRL
jgi:hypothetical protein